MQIHSQTQPPSVEDLSAEGKSSHQIEVKWSAYTGSSNEVLGFRLCLSKSQDQDACETQVPVAAESTMISVPFLETFTLYYIRIEASVANEGFSVPSYTQAMTHERGQH